MSSVVFLNGRFLRADEAGVSVWDGGWLHGAGLFETLRARYGCIFQLDAHLDRLAASARKLLFPLDRPDLPLTRDFDELLDCNGLSDARVRLTVTAGTMIEAPPPGADEDDPGDRPEPPDRDDRPELTVCVTVSPLTEYRREFAERGMAAAISPYKLSPTDPLAGHKCTAYLPRLLALRDAHVKGCNESLWFTTNNLLSEGSISNIFLVRADKLLTPPLDTPVLPGTTRAVVLELAKTAGIETEQRALNIDDLLDADEVFVTNSIMQVMPVSRVEKREIGSGQPGPITKRLREAFLQAVDIECKESTVDDEQTD
ncbi:MAG: hypothetical protein GY778_02565 [bacterium]|nr:hypothetical protein [bacterium]